MEPSDLNIPFILACLAFLVICLLCAGIMIYIGRVREKREMIEKIQADENEWSSIETHADPLEKSNKSGGPFVNFLSAIGLKVAPGKSAEDSETRLKFLRAGVRGENILSVFWGTKILLAIVFAMGFLIFAVVSLKTLDTAVLMYLVFFLALVGLILPDIWLRVRTAKRKKRIFRSFPDALDLLVVCVEAGMGLDMSIHRVGEEIGLTHPELAQELKLLNLELRAGKTRHSALRNLSKRADIEDVKSLVTLLIQTDRFGTSVGQALRVYSDSFRTTRYQRADEIAAKMGTKLIFPLAFFMFPAFFVVAVGPALIQIFKVFGPK
jgi:tight adherence protein C